MKRIKINKNIIINIIIFIIGFVLTLSIGYSATILFDSKDVKYNNTTGLSSTNVKDAIDELDSKLCFKTPFNLGDYFTLVPDASTYTIRTSLTGYTSDQTITPNELTLWRVIDIHCDGSVDAVSEYVSTATVYFSGVTGYANFVGGLQTIAAQYAKAGYTIDTRMMGYGGQTMTIPTKSATCTDTVCQTTTTYAFDGSTNTPPSTTKTPSLYTGTGQEYLGGVGGDTLYLKDYQLVSNIYKTDTATYGEYGLTAYNKAGIATMYWLASRRYDYISATYFLFNGRFAGADGLISSGTIRYFWDSWRDGSDNYAVRPIITLKSGVTISGGSGTKNSPYTLQ